MSALRGRVDETAPKKIISFSRVDKRGRERVADSRTRNISMRLINARGREKNRERSVYRYINRS